MIEDAYAPPAQPLQSPARRRGRSSDVRALLLLTTGVFFTLLRVQWSIADVTFDLFSDGLGYGLFALGAWRLRAASKWFTFAVPLALLFALGDVLSMLVTLPTGAWFSIAWTLTRVGALSYALLGSAALADLIDAKSIASRARLGNAAVWIAMFITFTWDWFSTSLPAELWLLVYVANMFAACLSMIVFTQLSTRVEHEFERANR